jgi:PiT family inorganic phosphate transporter
MALAHGKADAQKTMGIIVMALISYGALKKGDPPPTWVVLSCGLAIALGTMGGGKKIIKTMGHKMVKLQPVHGFAAETTAATVLSVAGHFGMPVSTTHSITTSIMGVGCAKRFNALNLGVVERILWAWVLTLPVTALLAYGILRLIRGW